MMPCEVAPRGQNEICVDVATKGRAAIPQLQFEAPRPQNGWSASLKGSDGFLHRIEGMSEFYGVLGLTRGASAETPPDEFIWARYIRDGAPLSLACLQNQYAVYLHIHSAEFRALYGQSHEARLGTCEMGGITAVDDHCLQCPLGTATR